MKTQGILQLVSRSPSLYPEPRMTSEEKSGANATGSAGMCLIECMFCGVNWEGNIGL